MRKIDVTPYPYDRDGEGQPLIFDVKSSLAAVLFNQAGLDAREVIRRDELAQRIEAATDEILLENAEWTKCIDGLNATDLKPLGRSVVTFLRRVIDAPSVDVKEKD